MPNDTNDIRQEHSRQEYMHLENNAPTTRISDAIFDFRTSEDGHSHNVNPNILMMRGIQGDTQNSHLARASERFAQQLDPISIQEQNRLMDNGFDTTAEMTSLFLQSKKHVEEHNYNSIIGTYLTFTHASNIRSRDVTTSFKRSIISSMKLYDTSRVCEVMEYDPPQQGLIRFERNVENVYGDYSEWEKILQLLSFDEEVMSDYLLSADSDFGNDLPTIKFVLTTLQQIGAEALSMTDCLKVYLLTNIKSITSLVAIKAFLKEAMPASFNVADASFVFTACMADARFTPEQFSEDLAWYMQNVILSPSFEEKCLFFMETKQTMMKWSQTEIVKENRGRVRLRYRVGAQTADIEPPTQDTRPVGGDNHTIDHSSNPGFDGSMPVMNTTPASQFSQMQEDSIQGWSLRARIPPAISHKSRLMAYVLMGQTMFGDPSEVIEIHFANDKHLASNILEQKVFKPHADVIIEFLRLLTVHVTPFEELVIFRDNCFTDFSYTDSKDLSWLRFLQLYIAVYQNEDIWPHIWKSFCGVLSHQVLITVANFKENHLYAVNKVADICMRGEQSSKPIVSTVS
jgi:hypothetical protein